MTDLPPRLTFLGACGTVTGSRFLLETGDSRLLVDCGLFQGDRALRRRNWEPAPIDPATLAGVVLSHAHLDQNGRLLGRARRADGVRALAERLRSELGWPAAVPDDGELVRLD